MNEREQEIFLRGVRVGMKAIETIESSMHNRIKKEEVKKEVNIQKTFKVPTSQRYMPYISKNGTKIYKLNPNWDGTPYNKGKKTNSDLADLGQE